MDVVETLRHRSLSDEERDRIRARMVGTIETWCAWAVASMRAQDAARQHTVEADGHIRERRGMRTLAAVPSQPEARAQVVVFLEELHRIGAPPPRALIQLDSYLHGAESEPLPLDERADFQAAVRHSVLHPRASDREIAGAAGVDHKTVARWRALPAWDSEVHIIRMARAGE
jgi:hypothetical protein